MRSKEVKEIRIFGEKRDVLFLHNISLEQRTYLHVIYPRPNLT